MRWHLLVLQSSLPQLRASLSQACKGPLLFFILGRIHNLNSRFYSASLDTKNRKYTKLTGACHPTQTSSTPQIPNPTQDLPHNVPTTIGHVATSGAPTDDITSAAAGNATSSTANTIDTAADAAASVSEANNTDIEDAPADATAAISANIQDLPADAAPPTSDITPSTADSAPPTADTDVALPTASTASSSRGDSSTQP
eukprot:g38751.t1